VAYKVRQIAFAMASLSVGCSAPKPFNDHPNVVGTIIDIVGGVTRPRILVRSEDGPSRTYFDVRNKTSIILATPDGGWTRGSIDDLRIGMVVNVWYAPIVALDTDPGQAVAAMIAVP
jgi:hypothetical protein